MNSRHTITHGPVYSSHVEPQTRGIQATTSNTVQACIATLTRRDHSNATPTIVKIHLASPKSPLHMAIHCDHRTLPNWHFSHTRRRKLRVYFLFTKSLTHACALASALNSNERGRFWHTHGSKYENDDIVRETMIRRCFGGECCAHKDMGIEINISISLSPRLDARYKPCFRP